MYYFDHRPSHSRLPSWATADHATEIPFVWGFPFRTDLPDTYTQLLETALAGLEGPKGSAHYTVCADNVCEKREHLITNSSHIPNRTHPTSATPMTGAVLCRCHGLHLRIVTRHAFYSRAWRAAAGPPHRLDSAPRRGWIPGLRRRLPGQHLFFQGRVAGFRRKNIFQGYREEPGTTLGTSIESNREAVESNKVFHSLSRRTMGGNDACWKVEI